MGNQGVYGKPGGLLETRGFIGNQEGLRKPGVYRKPGGLWETKGFA